MEGTRRTASNSKRQTKPGRRPLGRRKTSKPSTEELNSLDCLVPELANNSDIPPNSPELANNSDIPPNSSTPLNTFNELQKENLTYETSDINVKQCVSDEDFMCMLENNSSKRRRISERISNKLNRNFANKNNQNFDQSQVIATHNNNVEQVSTLNSEETKVSSPKPKNHISTIVSSSEDTSLTESCNFSLECLELQDKKSKKDSDENFRNEDEDLNSEESNVSSDGAKKVGDSTSLDIATTKNTIQSTNILDSTFSYNFNSIHLATPNKFINLHDSPNISFSQESSDNDMEEILDNIVTKLSCENKDSFKTPSHSRRVTISSPKVDVSLYQSDNEDTVKSSNTTPISFNNILKGVNAFIDARYDGRNFSGFVAAQLKKMGASVSKTLNSQVTHVIFKEGSKSIWKKAISKGIPLVSVAWIESCKETQSKVAESLFPPIRAEEYSSENFIELPKLLSKSAEKKSRKLFQEYLRKKQRIKDSLEKGTLQDQSKNSSESHKPSLNENSVSSSETSKTDSAGISSIVESLDSSNKICSPSENSMKKFANATEIIKQSPKISKTRKNTGGNKKKLCSKKLQNVFLKNTNSAKIRINAEINLNNSAVTESSVQITNSSQEENSINLDSAEQPMSKKLKPVEVIDSGNAQTNFTVTEVSRDSKENTSVVKSNLNPKKRVLKAKTKSLIEVGDLKEDSSVYDFKESSRQKTVKRSCATQRPKLQVSKTKKQIPSKKEATKINETMSVNKKTSRQSLKENDFNIVKQVVKNQKMIKDLVLTNIQPSDREVLYSVVNSLGGFTISGTVRDNTTHVVCGEKRRTINLLMALVRGLWVLSPHWIFKSLDAGHWLEEEPFELPDYFPALQVSRLERVASGPNYRQNLFSDLGAFFVSPNSQPSRDVLTQLINLAGGKVSNSLRRCSISVGPEHQTRIQSSSCMHVPEKWILDCISEHKVLALR